MGIDIKIIKPVPLEKKYLAKDFIPVSDMYEDGHIQATEDWIKSFVVKDMLPEYGLHEKGAKMYEGLAIYYSNCFIDVSAKRIFKFTDISELGWYWGAIYQDKDYIVRNLSKLRKMEMFYCEEIERILEFWDRKELALVVY